jgi:diacylglycerol kinase family enzyme/membrane-associated phospholipid phosphatase
MWVRGVGYQPPMKEHVSRWDRALFRQVAMRRWPLADPVLPRLSRCANRGALWFAVAGGLAIAAGRPGRRAALRGVGSLALASATVNVVGKRTVQRARPLLDTVPLVRQLRHQPFTTSFPSGHSASAAAFATGVALEWPRLGAAVAPLAWSVAFSRIYTGVHYPSDVLVGGALGVSAAFAVRGLVPPRAQPLVRPEQPRADAPALPDGRGLMVVVNETSGPPALLTSPAERLRTLLPHAELVAANEDDDFGELLEKAARQAVEAGGALGVYGGDGSVNRAGAVAMRHRLPLAVFPGGTYNHFARDLGVQTAEETARAVRAGRAGTVDVARFRSPSDPDAEPAPFLNTFSIGSYPELVRYRERWSRRLGSWPAGVLAAVQVLRTSRPVDVELGGRRQSVWLLFVGNGTYRGLGPAPASRDDLADGLLDVRVVRGGPFARTRLLAAAATGALTNSPVYTRARLRRLRIRVMDAGTHLAYDGEVAPAPGELLLDKVNEGLTVYRP